MRNLEDSKIFYPQTGIAKRVISGSLLTILGEAIRAMEHIFLVPLYLKAWGNTVYGEWLTIFALVAYLSLTRVGMQTYVVNRLTQCYSLGRLKDYNKILSSALGLYLLIIFPLLILVGTLTFKLPIADLLNIIHTPLWVVQITTFLLATLLLIEVPSGLIFGIYRSIGELPRGVMIINCRFLFTIIISAIILVGGGGFISLASARLILLIFFTLFVINDFKRRHKEIKLSLNDFSLSLGISFIGPGLFFFLLTITDLLKNQGPLLIIGVTLGSSFVTVFSIHRTICNLISKLITLFGQVIWPELTSMEVRGDYFRFKKAHYFLVKLTILLSISLAVILFFTGGDIIRIWTRDRVVFKPLLWNLFLLNMLIYSIWRPSSFVQLATNRHRFFSMCFFSSAVFGLLLSMFLIKIYGLIGVLVGFMIMEFIICGFLVPYRSAKIIKEDIKNFWEIIFKGIGIGFLLLMIGFPIKNLGGSKLLKISMMNIIIGISACVSGCLFLLNDFERKVIYSFVKKIMKYLCCGKKR